MTDLYTAEAVLSDYTYEQFDELIEVLASESAKFGDLEQVAVCRAALEGNRDARFECARIIADAAAASL